MNHNSLMKTLVGLCLIVPASTPVWSGDASTIPASGQSAQIPGHYPAPPGYYTTPPGYGQAPGATARPGWHTGGRYYPAPRFTPHQGYPQRPIKPRTQEYQGRPGPAVPVRPAESDCTGQGRLLAELDASRAELNATREELQQAKSLLEAAGAELDQVHGEYQQTAAGYNALDTKLATALTERDTAKERETELSIELMAAEKQLAQLSERLEQLDERAAINTDERAKLQQLLAEREAGLAEGKALAKSLTDERSGLRSELAARDQQLALMKTELQAAAEGKALVESLTDERNGLRSELAARDQQLALMKTELQAAAEGKALAKSLTDERNGLRSKLAARDQQLALMKTEVQAAADALIQAQAETATARTQREENESRQQACQAEQERLATALEQERGTRDADQQALAAAETAHAAVQAELNACNNALTTTGAELETAREQIDTMTATSAPAPAATPAEGDSDADGVADSEDLCPDTPPGIRVEPTGCAGNAPIILEGVSFRYDSHELSGKSHTILDRVAAILRQQPSLRLEIAGHTDTQGKPAYNQWLSQQRAATVMDYLVKQGVNPDNLTARGYGSQQPIADNRTREGLASNRRVELRRLP